METEEVKCKIFRGNNFGFAGRAAFEFSGTQRVQTNQVWEIMSVNDIEFDYSPKNPIT